MRLIKEKTKLLFIVFFFIVCALPSALMGVMDGAVAENRVISTLPVFIGEDGSFNRKFFDQLGTYVSEHFAFRDRLLALDGQIKYRLLGSPADPQVIIGEGGWLYFDQSIPSYMGRRYTDEELAAIAQRLREACDYLKALGKKPIVMIAPNKNSIYPQHMPERFGGERADRDIDVLQLLMDEYGVDYLDAKSVLLQGAGADEMYMHYDTHWNNTGARLVLNALYRKLGVGHSYKLSNYERSAHENPDLYSILNVGKPDRPDQRDYPAEGEYQYQGRFRTVDDLEIKTVNPEGNGKGILFYRDSFGRAIIPYVGEVFSQACFVRISPYDMSAAADFHCDYVVIEIVERNIEWLKDIVVPEVG